MEHLYSAGLVDSCKRTIEHLEAGDSIDDILEGFHSVAREQVIAFLEETKARVLAYAE